MNDPGTHRFVSGKQTNAVNEQSVHEYRLSSGFVVLIYLAAAIFGGVGLIAGGAYTLILLILAFGSLIYGIVLALDSRVKLRIDETGLSSHRFKTGHIRWADITSTALVQRTQGASVRHFLQLMTRDGHEQRVEISRLDATAEDILNVVDKYLEAER